MLYLTSKLSDYLRNAINMPTAAAVVEAAAAAVAAPETAAVAALAAAAEVAAAAAAAAETVPSIGRQTYVLPVGVVDIYQICCA
jgi:NADPH-dependent 2,4-dienoyl-CoA reductase/sulfur reductase-like enzyme